jgi:methionyl-tRNA formyltransferase
MRVLFLGRVDHVQTQEALDYCQLHFDTTYALGDWGDPIPQHVKGWQGDYIFNFLGRWILPRSVLDIAGKAAINFHPAPPEYPGFGPINWALYEDSFYYGVTCHHMAAKVDTGAIIQVRTFDIYPDDTVESVLKKTYCYQLYQFYDILDLIKNGFSIPVSFSKWRGIKRKRADLDALSICDITMSQAEIDRRKRAVTFGQWGIKWQSEQV